MIVVVSLLLCLSLFGHIYIVPLLWFVVAGQQNGDTVRVEASIGKSNGNVTLDVTLNGGTRY